MKINLNISRSPYENCGECYFSLLIPFVILPCQTTTKKENKKKNSHPIIDSTLYVLLYIFNLPATNKFSKPPRFISNGQLKGEFAFRDI